MIYPLVLELAAEKIPVVVNCRVLKLNRQRYYRWLKNPITKRDSEDAKRINAAIDSNRQDPNLGYRFLCDHVNELGFVIGEFRMLRLYNSQKIWSNIFKKKHKDCRKVLPPACDDFVQRNFTAHRPNKLWLTDITEHKTKTGKLYMCAIKDVFSNKIVVYSIDNNMRVTLAVSTLEIAVKHRRCKEVVVHSDRGAQFQSQEFREKLVEHSLVVSMGASRRCW